jgi:hypothetical protein
VCNSKLSFFYICCCYLFLELSPLAFNHELKRSLLQHQQQESPNNNSGEEPSSSYGNNVNVRDRRGGERSNRKSTASIYKVPTIPSILTTSVETTNKDSSSMNSNPISSPAIQMPSSSTSTNSAASPMKLNNVQSKIMQNSETRKSSPVVKKDSFSDAEGVSFIKKFLQKESLSGGGEKVPTTTSSSDLHKRMNQQQQNTAAAESAGFLHLKKSSSVGNNSYWSKFSNSQPAFLKKFFDKPEKPMRELVESETKSFSQQQQHKHQPLESLMSSTPAPTEQEEAEPVLGFSVAQKASFFMKLEHEQRFSKWRKNSLDSPTPPTTLPIATQQHPQVNSTPPESHKSRSSRQLTQPVTIMEVQQAAHIVNADVPQPPKSRTPLPTLSDSMRTFDAINDQYSEDCNFTTQIGLQEQLIQVEYIVIDSK